MKKKPVKNKKGPKAKTFKIEGSASDLLLMSMGKQGKKPVIFTTAR